MHFPCVLQSSKDKTSALSSNSPSTCPSPNCVLTCSVEMGRWHDNADDDSADDTADDDTADDPSTCPSPNCPLPDCPEAMSHTQSTTHEDMIRHKPHKPRR